MLYWLSAFSDVIGPLNVLRYITFRTGGAMITALVFVFLFGPAIIDHLRLKQGKGQPIRTDGPQSHLVTKKGTPTMGGLIILAAILVPTLLLAKLHNIYVLLILVTTIWLGTIGFLDDYIKVFRKDKKGLAGKFKIMGQIGLGLIIGTTMFFNKDIVIREKSSKQAVVRPSEIFNVEGNSDKAARIMELPTKSTKTTIPFLKNNEFDYSILISWIGKDYKRWTFLIFIPIIIFIIIAVSNGANLTDGLDGLATGSSAIIGITLGILAYVSGNYIIADYLNIMYIPNTGELAIYISAFVGACIGFLWYNSYPAQVFMGDTGSLALGGIVAVFAILIRKEIMIPIFCGIFLVENLSVVMQVGYFKYTKRRFGAGRRIFLMSPLHHHFQVKGYHESKIVIRFFIIGIMLAVLTIVTLKLR